MKPYLIKTAKICLLFIAIISYINSGNAQALNDFNIEDITNSVGIPVDHFEQFNGYTNHWHNTYTNWHRYGNLFKMSSPDVQATILQSKIDVAEDMGMPGLMLQEGFIFGLIQNPYSSLNSPTETEIEESLKSKNTLIIIDPQSELGMNLENRAANIFEWPEKLQSHQYDAQSFVSLKAFMLTNGNRKLFVISSNSDEQIKHFLNIIQTTKDILEKYNLHKGWFGVGSLLKSVTCTPGHPLELIGKGMNEGCSWFIFDGYMDFLAKGELDKWVEEINLPIVANVGFSPIYGCENYEGLQVQDMATKKAWYDYAHSRGGYLFKPVYDPDWDGFEFDGFIANTGNKEQIDHENVPFINKTGTQNGDLTSSMVLFIEKGKPLTHANIFDAIMNWR